MTPRPFTAKALAARWGCTPQHIYGLIATGKLGCFRVGSLIRIPVAEVERFECVASGENDGNDGGAACGSSSTEDIGTPSGSTRRAAPDADLFVPRIVELPPNA